jgi:Ca-activated chloride channel family protein
MHVSVTTVGVGTAAGGPVPNVDPTTGKANGFKQDLDGSVAHSALGADLLKEVAGRTRGTYVDAAASPDAAARVMASIGSLPPGAPSADAAGFGDEAADRAWWFIAAALFLLALDAILGAKANPRLAMERRPE